MTKLVNVMKGQEGHIERNIIISSMMEETLNNEESKLDPLLVSGNSSFKAERGLIQYVLPPSATHPKNT